MGLAEDLKALQALRDKGELSESAYAAARDAALGKQAPSTKATPIISKPTKIFLAVVILLVGFSILVIILNNGAKTDVFHQPLTITDEVQNLSLIHI